MSKESSIFLTQGIANHHARKAIVTNFVAQTETTEIAEMTRKT